MAVGKEGRAQTALGARHLGGFGELVTKRDQLPGAFERAYKSGKTACINVKCRGVISPIVAATSDKRDKASIE